jgi:hypothetical protein
MAKVLTLRQGVKVLITMLVALSAMVGGGALSDRLMSDAAAPLVTRWFGVTVAVLALAPWILMMVWAVAMGDEFIRQVALVGTAVAFVGDLLLNVGLAVARDAALVSATFDPPPLPMAMALWVAGVALAMIYYRLRP